MKHRMWLSGRGELYSTLLLSRIGMAALSAISLLALFMFLRQADRARKAANRS